MTSLHHSQSQKIINVRKRSLFPKRETIQIFNINTPSPSTIFINYENNKSNNDLSRNFNKRLTSISLNENKTKYANFYIFSKREYAFHKSIENNKKVFKYQNYSLFEEKNRTVNRLKRKIQRNNDILNNNHSSLYLTQNILKSYKTKLPLINKDKPINKDNDSTFMDKNQNKTQLIKKDITYLRNIINKNDTERLCKSKEEKKRNNKIYRKLDIFKRCNNKDMLKSKFIENMREFLFEKFNIKIKEEKTKILQENIKDKINYISGKTQSLKNEFSTFNDKFVGKFNEYIKQIIQMKDIEKNKDALFMNYIFKLKKDIVSLNLKNKKMQNDRDGLNRWMYFQICVKEKKKTLPKYYKIILEDKCEENKDELKKIDKSLIEQVLKYKNNIIYKNGDLFLEQIKKYENQNVELLNYYNSLREEIDKLNQEKDFLINNAKKQETEKSESELYEIKMKMLLILKNKYNKLFQHMKSIKILVDNNEGEEDELVNKKHTKLYYKTSKILDNLNSYIYYDFVKAGIVKSYKNITEESQIVLNLTKIEILTDIFIEKNASFKKNFSDKMNNFQTLLDKNKKLKKNMEQIKNIKLKLERERNKIFKKYNKIIILPTHKLNVNNVLTKKLILKKYREQRKNKEEIIDDYLYDLYESQHENNIENK